MDLVTQIETNSVQETEAFGAQLAQTMCDNVTLPPFIALYGDLGVGKTAFVRGFASVIAPNSLVRSPTFALVNEYRAKPRSLFHFDMYRIEDEDDLYSIGFYDYADRNGICLVEWSEKIPYALPSRYLRIDIEKTDPERPDRRAITVRLIGEDNK